MALSKDVLAEKGALTHLLDLRKEITDLLAAYPNLAKLEQNAKREATLLKKYGTTDLSAIAKASAKGKSADGVEKVSHKKGAGKKAKAAAAASAAGSAVPAESAPTPVDLGAAVASAVAEQAAPEPAPVG